ncbi:MAG: hypothetical protein PHO00_01600 [bacterium]|nr:hypothetical protein [bacterium]
MKKINFVLILIVLGFLSGCTFSATDWEIRNPYSEIDWTEYKQYKANFHTHTVYSDADSAPHEVIDAYKKLGYHILALTDHDSDHYAARPKILYPWTELNAIYNEIKDKPNPTWRWKGMPYRDISVVWQDRNPDELNMISIPGTEISRSHHIGSLFNDYAGNTSSEKTAIEEIGHHGGIAIMFHPGRYSKTVEWYVGIYRNYPYLIGLEIYNQGDRYPNDRDTWDAILTGIIKERPVWGFSNDDMHNPKKELGRNWNIMLLPELSSEWVRRGIENGMFFFVYAPDGHNGPSPPVIRSITVNPQKGTICLDVTGHERTEWISEGKIVYQGDSVDLNEIPGLGVYIRAVVYAADSNTIVGTQPFCVKSPAK